MLLDALNALIYENFFKTPSSNGLILTCASPPPSHSWHGWALPASESLRWLKGLKAFPGWQLVCGWQAGCHLPDYVLWSPSPLLKNKQEYQDVKPNSTHAGDYTQSTPMAGWILSLYLKTIRNVVKNCGFQCKIQLQTLSAERHQQPTYSSYNTTGNLWLLMPNSTTNSTKWLQISRADFCSRHGTAGERASSSVLESLNVCASCFLLEQMLHLGHNVVSEKLAGSAWLRSMRT